MDSFQKQNETNLISNLSFHEKIIIWGTREWLQNIRLAKDPRQSLIKAFSQLFIQESIHHFDRYMRITACNAIRPIDIRTHCCLEIGEGELEILACLAFSQGGFINLRYNILNLFLNNKIINDSIKSINSIAKSFSRAGYFFDIKDSYFIKAKVNPNDFHNVVFNQFNKIDVMKYYR